MSASIFDISFMYISKNYSEISTEEKKKVISAVYCALKNGATSDDLINKINNIQDLNKAPYSFFVVKSTGNLLNPDKFYYHNELRCYPPPPKRYWDINSGEIISEKQDYFLEMKASYTVENMVSYLSKKESLKKALQDKNRAIGSINFLLKKYDIDYLLFLFDTANDIYTSKQKYIRSLVEISEFEDEAKINYEQKITESNISGQNKVINKKRVLFECVK